ncbi:hypothetical protein AY483_09415 [Corynebacterium diphtheriae bv. mitis]|nr:hypothetical protein AY483_09415 [Corynebacterium diphtheriae bv. mitis]
MKMRSQVVRGETMGGGYIRGRSSETQSLIEGCSYIGCQPRGGEIGGGFSLWGCVDGFVFGHDS